jgi:hypothetical protein
VVTLQGRFDCDVNGEAALKRPKNMESEGDHAPKAVRVRKKIWLRKIRKIFGGIFGGMFGNSCLSYTNKTKAYSVDINPSLAVATS